MYQINSNSLIQLGSLPNITGIKNCSLKNKSINKANNLVEGDKINSEIGIKIKQETIKNEALLAASAAPTNGGDNVNNNNNSNYGGPKKRVSANKKERRRTQSINNAFSDLRNRIPHVPVDTKLSKIKTLKLATKYIEYLMDVLEQNDPILLSNGFQPDLGKLRKESRSKEIKVLI